MGERYLITGSQLGIFMSDVPKEIREKLGNEIIQNQHLFNTNNTDVKKDAVELIRKKPLLKLRFRAEVFPDVEG